MPSASSELIKLGHLTLKIDEVVQLKLFKDPGKKEDKDYQKDVKSLVLCGQLGEGISAGHPGKTSYTEDGALVITWRNRAQCIISHRQLDRKGHRYKICWTVESSVRAGCMDTYDLAYANWYGGPAVRRQQWPVQKWGYPLLPMVADDAYSKECYGAVQERYWLSSRGAALYVEPEAALFVAINDVSDPNKLNLVAKYEYPYRKPPDMKLMMTYYIYQHKDITATHQLAMGECVQRPLDIPDEKMFRYAKWTTYAHIGRDVTQEKALDFAARIRQNGYRMSVFELSDDWTSHYGDVEFDTGQFPDPVKMVKDLQEEGVKVSLWVHPFASLLSKAAFKGDYWMGTGIFPGLITWSQGVAKVLDPTNEEACEWYRDRLLDLIDDYDVASFCFDFGEICYLPNFPRTTGTEARHLMNPNPYPTAWAELAYSVDKTTRCQELRVGMRTQHLPLMVCVMRKDPVWTTNNGIKTVIPSVLHHGICGYPFVMVPMVGPHADNNTFPDRELYIRWIQACAMMPCVKMSLPPWLYDDQVVRICKKSFRLHERYGDLFIQLAREAVATGAPIIRPMWWRYPKDQVAQGVDDQYMVGDALCVAPVVEKGRRTRNVYLPEGMWKDQLKRKVLKGGRWYKDYPADIEDLPYFTLVTESAEASRSAEARRLRRFRSRTATESSEYDMTRSNLTLDRTLSNESSGGWSVLSEEREEAREARDEKHGRHEKGAAEEEKEAQQNGDDGAAVYDNAGLNGQSVGEDHDLGDVSHSSASTSAQNNHDNATGISHTSKDDGREAQHAERVRLEKRKDDTKDSVARGAGTHETNAAGSNHT